MHYNALYLITLYLIDYDANDHITVIYYVHKVKLSLMKNNISILTCRLNFLI